MSPFRYKSNLSWLLFDKILKIVGGIFVTAWMARYLGTSDFGMFNYAIAIVTFFLFLSSLGLEQVVVRELTKFPNIKGEILGTSFFLKVAGSIFALVGSYYLSFHIVDNPNDLLLVPIIAVSLLFRSFEVIDYYYQSIVLSKRVVIARSTAFSITMIVYLYLINNQYELLHFSIAYSAEYLVVALILIGMYGRDVKDINKWSFSKSRASVLLKDSWPLMLSTALVALHLNIDKIMIGSFLTNDEVGIYSAATRLSLSWMFIPTIIVSTFIPYFIKLRSSDKHGYQEHLMYLYSGLFYIGLFVGVFVLVFGEDLILLIFGKEYIKSYEALVLNIWAGIFISQGMARGVWLLGENLQIYRLYNNVFTVILNIVGNALLIPKYGIQGAAVSTLLSYGASVWIISFIWAPLRAQTLLMAQSVYKIHIIKLYVFLRARV